MAIDYFDWKLALNELTGTVVPGANAQVYAIEDSSFTTPLSITDMSDVPLSQLTASPTGLFPPFKVTSGQTRVVVRSADVITPITSAMGSQGVPGEPGVASVEVVTGLESRPTSPVVIWIGGTSRPAAMANGDVWFQSGPTVPTRPTITTTTLNTLTAGSPFAQQLSASGTTPMTWAVTSGALPSGVSLTSGGVLSGTPSSAGAYSFTVTAANSQGTDSRGFSGTVTSSVVAPTITTTVLAALTQGAPFSQSLAAVGTAPMTFSVSAGSLPAGLSLSSTGVLSGTPSSAGAFSFTVQATNSAGSDTQAFSGTVSGSAVAPVITTTTLNSLSVGVLFAQTLAASGSNPKTWSVAAGTLPAGLSLNATTGALSGTPSVAGAYSFTVQASNSGGSDTQAYSGTISATAAAPVITTTTLSPLQATVSFSQTLSRTGSTPMTWGISAGSLPAGMGINSSTGTLSGTPTTAGAYSFTVQATNSAGSDTQAYTGTVAAAPAPVPMSIFGSATPGDGGTIYTDGGGSLSTGARFYATKTINVVGLRVWNPSASDSTFLNADVTAYALPGDWVGSDMTSSSWTSPAQTKTHTATRVAGQWTDILFDAPVTLNPISASANTPDHVILGVQYAGGNHYVVVSGASSSAIPSGQDAGVYLSEQTFRRGVLSPNGATNSFYGIDMIFEVV